MRRTTSRGLSLLLVASVLLTMTVLWRPGIAKASSASLMLPWPSGYGHDIETGCSYDCPPGHTGVDRYAIDFNLSSGSLVSATLGGTAHVGSYQCWDSTHTYYSTSYLVWIDHGGGLISYYAHIDGSNIKVAEGQTVVRGQVLALSDNSGSPYCSTGPHLHFAMHSGATSWYNGNPYLPEPMVAPNGGTYTGFGAYGAMTGASSPVYTSTSPLACWTPSLTASPASPTNAGNGGSAIVFTAMVSGCPNARFRFYVTPPGLGSGSPAQDYSALSTYSWSMNSSVQPVASGPGLWHIEVDVRDDSETTPPSPDTPQVSYDAIATINYQLNGCSAASMSASPPSSQTAPLQVTFASSATCPLTPAFQFWAQPPGGSWGYVQDYGPSAVYTWSTVNGPVGTWHYQVYARDQGTPPTPNYEITSSVMAYALATTPCSTPTLSANPASPGATGRTITFTAATNNCPDPQFRYWIRPPGGSWQVVQDYGQGSGAIYSWTTGTAITTQWTGSFGIEVDVRDAAERTVYDAVRNITYVLNGCTGAGLTTTPSGSATRGTTVALAGNATCPGTPEYRFWTRAPGGSWTVLTDWSASYTTNWTTTTGMAAGTWGLEVDIRDQGAAPGSYETTIWINYSLT
jgi:hypothetical protein